MNSDAVLIQQNQPKRVDVSKFINSTQDFLVLGKQNFNLTDGTKVFVLSPHKSGTTSLGVALKMVGIEVAPEIPYYH